MSWNASYHQVDPDYYNKPNKDRVKRNFTQEDILKTIQDWLIEDKLSIQNANDGDYIFKGDEEGTPAESIEDSKKFNITMSADLEIDQADLDAIEKPNGNFLDALRSSPSLNKKINDSIIVDVEKLGVAKKFFRPGYKTD